MHIHALDMHWTCTHTCTGPTLGNPAAVGLAGFGLNTLLLQFHNLGYMAGVGPVVWSGLILGGTAQLIAGEF